MRQHFSQFLNLLFPPVCVHCGREGDWLCLDMQAQVNRAAATTAEIAGCEQVFIRAAYDTPAIQALVQALKYRYWTGIEPVIDQLIGPMALALKQLPDDTVIVPVPLHRSRFRERGFNQSQLVARAIHRQTGWSMVQALDRIRNTQQQARLKELARYRNVKDAFRTTDAAPRHVLIVDDVITTGATMAMCATELRRRGAERVFGFALAKG